MYYLYILRSRRDLKLYIGITKDLIKRLSEHNSGFVCSTKHRRLLALVYYEKYQSHKEAARREWLLKHTPGAGKQKYKLIKEFLKLKGCGYGTACRQRRPRPRPEGPGGAVAS
ncbi:GIY-YIG nuclease family protein [Patescibacteria group bacterium]|nr:GIY-YIG nuclease family protein [Patescibacteria group bacterium]MBU1890988.1 GIY-YIG nuclease family protein [Patescibacteria group bacterium]